MWSLGVVALGGEDEGAVRQLFEGFSVFAVEFRGPVEQYFLRVRHRADVVDVLGEARGDVRVVEEVDEHEGVDRVLRRDRDRQVVRPQRGALFGDNELEVGAFFGVDLVDVTGPGHGDPDVAVGERLDVVLLVVGTHDPVVALLLQDFGSGFPVLGGGVFRSDTVVEQREVGDLLRVAHHADPSLELGVPQVLDGGDFASDPFGVVGDAGDPRGVGNGVLVAVVVGRHRVELVGELGKVRQLVALQRGEVAQCDELGELLPVADDHEVGADVVAVGQERLDLSEPRRHVLDGLAVFDLDAGLLGEPLELRLFGVHVERPVDEADFAVAFLPVPEVLRGGGLLALSLDTAAGERQGGSGKTSEFEGVAAAHTTLGEATQHSRIDGVFSTHGAVVPGSGGMVQRNG